MESKIKLLKVLDIMNTTDQSHPLTASKICQLLNKEGIDAERKSICRDINTLIKHGYKIVLCADNKKGYYLAQKAKKADTRPVSNKIPVTLYYDAENEDRVEKIFGKKESDYNEDDMSAEFFVEQALVLSKLLEAGDVAQILSPENIRDQFLKLISAAEEFYNKPRGKKKIDYWLL